MPRKRKRSFEEMQELRKEYRKALKKHSEEQIELAMKKDIEGMKNLGPRPEEPSWFELTEE